MGGWLRGWFAAGALALPVVGHAADVRVLVTSGTRTGDLGIARATAPRAGPDGVVYFLGTSTTLALAGTDGTPLVRVATGDPLPPPLQGTVNEIVHGVVAGGLAGFLTDANGPEASSVIFLIDGGAAEPVAVVPPSDGIDIRAFSMNARGDVAYRTASATGGEMRLRPRATGVAVALGAMSSRHPRRVPEPVIDESGATAWGDDPGNVFYAEPVGSTRVVASGVRFVLPRRGAATLAIHATFGVAFVTRDAAMRWSPATGETTVLAHRRDRLGSKRLTRFTGVGFLEDGSVVIGVRAADVRDVRAVADGLTTWAGSPARVSATTRVEPTLASAVFEAAGTAPTALVRPGDAIARAGTIESVAGYAVGDGTIVFTARLTDGRTAVGRRRGRALQAIVVDGDTRGTRSIALVDPVLDASGTTAATTAMLDGDDVLVVSRGNRHPRTVRSRRRGRFALLDVEQPLFSASRLFALGREDGGDGGLFAARGRRFAPAVVPGAQLPGGRELQSVEIAAADTRIVFAATDRAGLTGLYARGEQTERLAGLLTVPLALAVRGPDVAVLTDDGNGAAIAVVAGGTLRPILAQGDATAMGQIAEIGAMAVVGDEVVAPIRLTGNGIRRALVALPLR